MGWVPGSPPSPQRVTLRLYLAHRILQAEILLRMQMKRSINLGGCELGLSHCRATRTLETHKQNAHVEKNSDSTTYPCFLAPGIIPDVDGSLLLNAKDIPSMKSEVPHKRVAWPPAAAKLQSM